jgi:hypothetical protein
LYSGSISESAGGSEAISCGGGDGKVETGGYCKFPFDAKRPPRLATPTTPRRSFMQQWLPEHEYYVDADVTSRLLELWKTSISK